MKPFLQETMVTHVVDYMLCICYAFTIIFIHYTLHLHFYTLHFTSLHLIFTLLYCMIPLVIVLRKISTRVSIKYGKI